MVLYKQQKRKLGVRKITLEADEDRVGSINGNGNHTWSIFAITCCEPTCY
ncbi:hypothetical protein MKW98_009406 [Papaver atlanticum]|uniref:Uncharacterized protein n=1 Tax=Papaver atlanticum TaxID=357466 RepID=A0AAD4SH06_9MAGN|nr:hypothetical protein MKW98_009406 [Papaver atlanticum]